MGEALERLGGLKLPRLTPRRLTMAGVILALLVLPPFLARVAPGLFSDYRLGQATRAVVFVIAALSLNILMGYAGQISLGHAAFLGVGAFTTGYLTWWYGFPFITGFIASGVLGGVLALLVGIPALRIRGLYLAVSTLAFGIMMEQMVFSAEFLTGGQAGLRVPRPLQGGFEFVRNGDFFVLCLLVFLLVWLFDRTLTSTKVGRAFFAIREDEQVAASFGVEVARFKLLAFVLSGIIAGLAGSLYGSLIFNAQHEEFSFQRGMSLAFVIIIVVGGLGSRAGVITAAAFFAVFSRLDIDFIPRFEMWVPIIGGLLLIYTVARHPGGLAQAWLEAREAKESKAARAGTLVEEDIANVLPALPAVTVVAEREGAVPARPGAPVLQTSDVSVNFGGVQALQSASIEVPHGKVVGLIGPNGAGKTTLFNVVSGFIKPTSGAVKLKGQDVTEDPPHVRASMGLGRTFQLIGLAKNLTVRENFLLAQHPLARYGVLPGLFRLPKVGTIEDELEERSKEAIAALGFERFRDTPVRNLSHGQQRLVELGCSLATSPDLLLLDEPSGGMAPAAAESLAERLIDVRDKLGRTILLIEHHIPLVLAVCDEIYVLSYGSILAHGSTEEITSNPEVVAAYFGEAVA